MSWASLASDQCVSTNNLQDAATNSVFILKNTIPPSTKQITKTEAEYYVYCAASGGTAANQLVIKSELVPTAYEFDMGDDGGTTGASGCLQTVSSLAYVNLAIPISGSVFWADAGLTTLYPMSGYSGLFIKYKLTTAGTYTKARFNLATSAINNAPSAC